MPDLKYLKDWIKCLLIGYPAPWGLLGIYKSRAAFRAAVQRYQKKKHGSNCRVWVILPYSALLWIWQRK